MVAEVVRQPFIWYGNAFLRITAAISRREEFAADACAVHSVGRAAHVDGAASGSTRTRPAFDSTGSTRSSRCCGRPAPAGRPTASSRFIEHETIEESRGRSYLERAAGGRDRPIRLAPVAGGADRRGRGPARRRGRRHAVRHRAAPRPGRDRARAARVPARHRSRGELRPDRLGRGRQARSTAPRRRADRGVRGSPRRRDARRRCPRPSQARSRAGAPTAHRRRTSSDPVIRARRRRPRATAALARAPARRLDARGADRRSRSARAAATSVVAPARRDPTSCRDGRAAERARRGASSRSSEHRRSPTLPLGATRARRPWPRKHEAPVD